MYQFSDQTTALRRESSAIGGAMLLYYLIGSVLPLVFYAAAELLAGPDAVLFMQGGGLRYDLIQMFIYAVSFAVPLRLLGKGSEWQFSRPKKPFGLLIAPVFLLMILSVNIVTSVFSNLLQPVGAGDIPALTLPESPLRRFVFLLQYTLLPAAFEELLFRGAILSRLRRFGEWFAVLSSSLLFTLLHSGVAVWPGVFLMSSAFGYMAIASGSLIPPVALHFMNNALAVLELFSEHISPGFQTRFYAALFAGGTLSAVSLTFLYLSRFRKAGGESLLWEPPPEQRRARFRAAASPQLLIFITVSVIAPTVISLLFGEA